MLKKYTDSELYQLAHRCFDLLADHADGLERTNMQMMIGCVHKEIVRRAVDEDTSGHI